MGLLDDAIREHLELKRRRGADASELERQEHEALGPPRQGEFVKPEGEARAAEPPTEDEPLVPPAAEDEPAPPVEDEPPPVEEEPPAPAAERPAEAEPWLDEPDEVPVDDALEHRAAQPPAPDPDVVEPDPEPSGDDVLEETPDFLQETPEHDRLWFEQKPPRDFDFDK
jgi:hypothetical protein